MASSALAVVGGFLMLAGGVANHSFLVSLLSIAGGRLGALVGGVPGFAIELAIYIVSFLVGLGGLTVIVGGLTVFAGHATTGRLLIALGGGAGFLGLLLTFGYTVFADGFASAVSHGVYWVGLVMAIVGRSLA